MAALDFPASPTLNQTYTANGKTWTWDGQSWDSTNAITSISGATIDNSVIGGTTPAAGTFTSLTANSGLLVNAQAIATNYTVASGYNAVSAGPVTVNSGITVTISSGSNWVVV